MKRLTLMLVALVAFHAMASTPHDYAYTFAIDTASDTARTSSSAWTIELTPAVYAWTQDPALGDIEVFNAAGHPVPFAPIRSAPEPATQVRAVELPLLALPAATANAPASDLRLVIDRDAQGRLRRIDAGEQASAPASAEVRNWLLDASALERPFDALELAWRAPASGIVARFGIDASEDLYNWRPLAEGSVLALEHDGVRLERHEIAFAPVPARYLRLKRLDDGIALEGLGVKARSLDAARDAPREWIEASHVAATAAPDDDTIHARFEYTLDAALPIDRVRIELANDNAVAAIALFAKLPAHARADWSELARINAFRLRFSDERVRNADIDVAIGARVRAFRVESRVPIANAPQLSLGYRPQRFVFLAEGDGPYRLAVGSAHARRADYPIDAALAGLRAKAGRDWQPPLAHLGPATISAGESALKAAPEPTAWRRWLLWAVLIAAAASVGGFAFNLLRSSEAEHS